MQAIEPAQCSAHEFIERRSHRSTTYQFLPTTGDERGFYNAVKWVYGQTVPAPAPSLLSFEYTREAALKNSLIMKRFNYDLDKVIEAQPGTTTSYGSEVRPMRQLEVLLHNHRNFERFRDNMTNGISYPIRQLDEDTRVKLLHQQLNRGNHKSALKKSDRHYVTKAMETDVKRGFGIIMTRKCAERIKGAEAYPLGLQHQMTINEKGEPIPKKRVCHDLSWEKSSGLAINQRVIEEEVPDVLFGYALKRVLHMVHHLRYHYPNRRILLNKVDIEKAYRRFHTKGSTAAKCIAMWFAESLEDNHEPTDDEIAIALQRLPFGSNPAPAEFSNGSDITFDLASDLMNCELWDTDDLPCPLRDEIPPP